VYLHNLDYPLDSNLVGGKAASLSRLKEFGVAVPEAWVINKSLFNFYKREASFPTEFLAEFTQALEKLYGAKLIVRSSAIGEDSESHSFAGQLDSFVVENNFEHLLEAIKKCWAGLENERVLAYQEISGHRLVEMGVVIQNFVEADYAGVSFTQDPNAKGKSYTEYVKGAGEQLVSGKVTPKNFSLSKGEMPAIDLPFNAQALLEQTQKLKEFYGCDLDIEWVAKGASIYFVQARPITVENKTKVFWSNTNLNENYPNPISPLLYSIARDSYYHYFKNIALLLKIEGKTIRALEYDFANTVGIWGNRIYYNMTSIHNILASSFLNHYFKDAFNQFVGYTKKDVGSNENTKGSSMLGVVLSILRLNFGLEKHVQNIEAKVSDFSRQVDVARGKEELSRLFYQFLDLRFNQWYHASLADLFSMIHYKLLAKISQKFYGSQSVGVHNTLIQAIPGLISSEPLNATWDIVKEIDKNPSAKAAFKTKQATEVLTLLAEEKSWQAIKIKFDQYLKEWGFRCSGELMFLTENYIEQPAKFVELLQSYMRNTAQDPRLVIAEKQKARRQALRRFSWKIIKKRHIILPLSLWELAQLHLVSKLCKQAIASRERVRYKQAEMYYKFKVLLQALAKIEVEKGRLATSEAIFYLSYKEIGEMLSSSEVFYRQSWLDARVEAFRLESEKDFPQNFSTNFGERPAKVAPELSLVAGAKEFSGLAASGGRIKGRVKVLDSVFESDKLEKGDILITKQTDPGWAMVFPIIGGLIVERGGALSHGAIVAREFGIPAVIGIEGICNEFKDGDEVILDGDLGKIQKLS
jgi:phosphohistidine swiveling domain-containing protein